MPWARSGAGYECRVCASYLIYNYRGKLKNELAEQLESDHDGTVRARYVDELADYELGERGVKRARLQTQQKTTTASVVKHGSFWPKQMRVLSSMSTTASVVKPTEWRASREKQVPG